MREQSVAERYVREMRNTAVYSNTFWHIDILEMKLKATGTRIYGEIKLLFPASDVWREIKSPMLCMYCPHYSAEWNIKTQATETRNERPAARKQPWPSYYYMSETHLTGNFPNHRRKAITRKWRAMFRGNLQLSSTRRVRCVPEMKWLQIRREYHRLASNQ